MTEWKYKNWYVVDEDSIYWLYFDKADSATNVLSVKVLDELDRILRTISVKQARGLVILSAKRSGFIAGADISEFTALQDERSAEELMRKGQAVFSRLEKLPFPAVSLIHGFCLGGGLELALACSYRVAKDDITIRLGLPEVKLGIHPGFGGTIRLPKLIGAPQAMDLILTGKTVNVYKAKEIGLVDYIVPDRHLKDMAVKCIEEMPEVQSLSLMLKFANNAALRPIMKKILHERTAKKINRKHYPAPFAVIDLWGHYADRPQVMLEEEAKSVARLMTGPTAQNLIGVFFLRNRLKAMTKGINFSASHIHVIGAGTMGGDMAALCALQGLRVTLQSRRPASIASAIKRAHYLFKKRLVNPRLVRNAMDRLMPDIGGAGIPKADVVIEAVFRNIEFKQNLYRDIETQMRDDALLATSTSGIPLEELVPLLSRPERLVGLHFFNPVETMPLVEIVSAETTDPDAVNRAIAFTGRIDHLPLPVKSAPGFLVNRILMPYLMEAVLMVEEGLAPAHIDNAALDFGMSMGPLFLADTMGLDECLHIADSLSEKTGMKIPDILKMKVDKGLTGKKSGQGFYEYKNGKQVIRKKKSRTGQSGDIQQRLILRMVNEAVCCLDDGIVDDAGLLDAGAVFGAGFAPFRGGIMKYCITEGIESIQQRIQTLEKRFGERFHIANGWEKIKL
ncbi:MAG: enoyl-CoA hydratase/isomerase family protein [Nitrospiraceae bacterium]|nr:MAG: enoyl-CoA hydratase/isomerase family protein [Nitrospiraceae bacterium]